MPSEACQNGWSTRGPADRNGGYDGLSESTAQTSCRFVETHRAVHSFKGQHVGVPKQQSIVSQARHRRHRSNMRRMLWGWKGFSRPTSTQPCLIPPPFRRGGGGPLPGGRGLRRDGMPPPPPPQSSAKLVPNPLPLGALGGLLGAGPGLACIGGSAAALLIIGARLRSQVGGTAPSNGTAWGWALSLGTGMQDSCWGHRTKGPIPPPPPPFCQRPPQRCIRMGRGGGWLGPPTSEGPPMVPAEGRPKDFEA